MPPVSAAYPPFNRHATLRGPVVGIAETIAPAATERKTARHIPTNHLYRVVLEIPGVGVELEDTERRSTYTTWAKWLDGNIWSSQ